MLNILGPAMLIVELLDILIYFVVFEFHDPKSKTLELWCSQTNTYTQRHRHNGHVGAFYCCVNDITMMIMSVLLCTRDLP